jgi:hypothetical protein
MKGAPVPDQTELHRTKNYRYLPAISAYSSGAAAESGYDIVGLRFSSALSIHSAFLALDRELEKRGLAPTAVVGFELRSPQPVGLGAFTDFNSVYEQLLDERGMLDDGVNPVARTNVAPVRAAPDDVAISTAFVVRPCTSGGVDFVIAGSGEVAGPLAQENIVAFGDTSQRGLTEKAEFVIGEIVSRLTAVGAGPDAANVINVYTAHEIAGLPELVESGLTSASQYGYVHWHARPPVTGLEFEMDCRRISAWEVI